MARRSPWMGPVLGVGAVIVALLAYDEGLRNRAGRVLDDFFSIQGQIDGILLGFLCISVVLIFLMVRN